MLSVDVMTNNNFITKSTVNEKFDSIDPLSIIEHVNTTVVLRGTGEREERERENERDVASLH